MEMLLRETKKCTGAFKRKNQKVQCAWHRMVDLVVHMVRKSQIRIDQRNLKQPKIQDRLVQGFDETNKKRKEIQGFF